MTRIVLVGNQNSGKTTLFNALTGENQHVGNWPGVTVAKRVGLLRGRRDVQVIDLPGTYSLTPYTGEERVTREVLLAGEYDAIVNVVDATCLQRGLYLTLQLLELGRPVLIALNMMDESRRRGDRIDLPRLSEQLGVPVIPMTARTGEGIDRLQALLPVQADSPKPVLPPPAPTPDSIDARYRRISRLLSQSLVQGSPRPTLTERIDRIILHSRAGLPLLLALMAGLMWSAFGPVGSAVTGVLDALLDRTTQGMAALLAGAGASPWLAAFVTDGMLAGVGSVLSFLPALALLLLGLSVLEDCGLMARAAFLMDGPLRRVGLNGRAFIPMLLGFGCTVPAAMAARTMASRRDRVLTTLLLPFVSCSAKLPVYALIAKAVLGSRAWVVIAALYAGGMLLLCAASMLLGTCCLPGEAAPLLIELPPYRLPTLRSVLRGMRDRAGEFLRRVFTVILLTTAAVWLLRSLTPVLRWTEDPSESLLWRVASLAAPLLSPLGFASTETACALLTGLMAKESIVSTLTILMDGAPLSALFPSARAAMSFLTFVLLYTPCTAAMAAMADSLGSRKKAVCAALGQMCEAWVCAWGVYHLCNLF